MSSDSTDYRITFPQVLRRLDYARNIHHVDCRSITVDGRESLTRYFREMYLGVGYERYVHSSENRSEPNCLTRGNFTNAVNVRARGWSYAGVEHLINSPWSQLERIPPDADLFETEAYDAEAVEMLTALCLKAKGIQVANACKLFYQKRPRLIPILDSHVRQVMNVYWIGDKAPDDYRAVFRLGFQRFRELVTFGDNMNSLNRIREWLASEPPETLGLPLSSVRIIDILAWSVLIG